MLVGKIHFFMNGNHHSQRIILTYLIISEAFRVTTTYK